MAADGDDLEAFTLETGTSVEALREARRESRATLDQQITLLHEIDDKAMRLTRTSVVVLGIIVSAVGVSDPGTVTALGGAVFALSALGVLCLVGSIFVGIGLYTVSASDFGVGDSYRRDLQAGNYTEREWLTAVLAGYDEWTTEVEAVNRRKETYLFVAYSLMLAAFVSFTLATGLLVMPQ